MKIRNYGRNQHYVWFIPYRCRNKKVYKISKMFASGNVISKKYIEEHYEELMSRCYLNTISETIESEPLFPDIVSMDAETKLEERTFKVTYNPYFDKSIIIQWTLKIRDFVKKIIRRIKNEN